MSRRDREFQRRLEYELLHDAQRPESLSIDDEETLLSTEINPDDAINPISTAFNPLFEVFRPYLSSEEKRLLDYDIDEPLPEIVKIVPPYTIFSSDVHESVKAELIAQEISPSMPEISKAISARWKLLSEEDEESYVARFDALMIKGEASIAIFNEKYETQQAAISLGKRLQTMLDFDIPPQEYENLDEILENMKKVSSKEGEIDGQADINEETKHINPSLVDILPLSRVRAIVQRDPSNSKISKEALLYISRAAELFAGFLGVSINEYATVRQKKNIRNDFWSHILLLNPELQFLKHCSFLTESSFAPTAQDKRYAARIEREEAKKQREYEKLTKKKGKKQGESDDVVNADIMSIKDAFTKQGSRKSVNSKEGLRVSNDIFVSYDPFAQANNTGDVFSSLESTSNSKVGKATKSTKATKSKVSKATKATKTSRKKASKTGMDDDNGSDVDIEIDNSDDNGEGDEHGDNDDNTTNSKRKMQTKESTSKNSKKMKDTASKTKIFDMFQNIEQRGDQEQDDEKRQARLENMQAMRSDADKSTTQTTSKRTKKQDKKKSSKQTSADSDDDYIEGIDYHLDENGDRVYISVNNNINSTSTSSTSTSTSVSARKSNRKNTIDNDNDNSDFDIDVDIDVDEDDMIEKISSKKPLKNTKKNTLKRVLDHQSDDNDDDDDNDDNQEEIQENTSSRHTSKKRKVLTSQSINEHNKDSDIGVMEEPKSSGTKDSKKKASTLEERVQNKFDQFFRK